MAAVIHAASILSKCIKDARLHDYEAAIRAHPLCEPSFRPALAALRRWTNEDFARVTRLAPPLVHVTPGVSTEKRYLGRFLASLALNLDKVQDMRTVSRALGVSRRYSW
jgi:hypothetical protein